MFCLSSTVHGTGASQHVRPRLGARWRVLGEGWYPFLEKGMGPHPSFPYLTCQESSGQVAVVHLTEGSIHRLPGEGWSKPSWNPIYPLLAVQHRDRHTWGVYDMAQRVWLYQGAVSPAPVHILEWSPGGHALLVFDDEGRGWMFPVAAGRLHPPEALPPVPLREMRRVRYVSWVLNGRGLLWEGTEGEALLCLSRGKRRVILGERWWLSRNTLTGVRLQDGALEIWDLAHLRVTGRVDLGNLPVSVLYISPDGQKIAVDVRNPRMRALHLWVVRPNGAKAFSLNSRHSPTCLPKSEEAAWSPDGRFLSVTGSRVDDVVLVLDTETGEKISLPRPRHCPGAETLSTVWSPISPSRFIAMTFWKPGEGGKPGVYIFDVHQRHLWGDPEASGLLGWHPGGRHLLVSRPEGLGLLDAEWRRVHILPKEMDVPDDLLRLVTWSGDGRRAVTRHGPWLVLWDLVQQRMLDVFDFWSQGIGTLAGIHGYPHGLLIWGDGRWLMLGTG